MPNPGGNQPKTDGTTPSLDSHPDQDGDQALRQIIRQRLKTLGKSPGTAERIAGVPRDTIKSGSPQTGVGGLRRDRRVGEGCWQFT